MSVTANPALAALMRKRHKDLMVHAAVAGAAVLHDNLNSETHGTGVHWPWMPNRSSAPGQFPVKQTGDLVSGVGIAETQGTGAKVIIEDDLDKLIQLEFAPPVSNPGDPGTSVPWESGGRAPMWTTMTDQETIDAMNDAIRGAGP